MATFRFALISPESGFEGEVNSVSLRTAGGDIGILANHVPYVGAVQICDCQVVRADNQMVHLAVRGGFIEVDPDGTVTLLADVVLTADEIDEAAIQAERDALGVLGGSGAGGSGTAAPGGEDEPAATDAEAEARWAQVRLDVLAAGMPSGAAAVSGPFAMASGSGLPSGPLG